MLQTKDHESAAPMANWLLDSTSSILVVDDVAVNIDLLCCVLSSVRCRVETASSGRQALEILEETDFAAVLLDVRMIGLDGMQVATRMMQSERLIRTPIIFITSDNGEQIDEFAAGHPGTIDFVRKPFLPNILCSKVRVLLELHALRARTQREG